MSEVQRLYYVETYGINYVKVSVDTKYEYGYYIPYDNKNTRIEYKFRLCEFE